jgi:tRNA U55 pseudouridine synthase TruB
MTTPSDDDDSLRDPDFDFEKALEDLLSSSEEEDDIVRNGSLDRNVKPNSKQQSKLTKLTVSQSNSRKLKEGSQVTVSQISVSTEVGDVTRTGERNNENERAPMDQGRADEGSGADTEQEGESSSRLGFRR